MERSREPVKARSKNDGWPRIVPGRKEIIKTRNVAAVSKNNFQRRLRRKRKYEHEGLP